MDWKLFATTFITLFIAEFGDKTQLAAMAASAHSKGAWEVAVDFSYLWESGFFLNLLKQ